MPMMRGLLDYFPDALAAVAHGSFVGNEKHNPGEELHHARGKSMDHGDCIIRHLVQRGEWDIVVAKDGTVYHVRHSTWVAWRSLALLQQEIERDEAFPLARGAKDFTNVETVAVDISGKAKANTNNGKSAVKHARIKKRQVPVHTRRPRKGEG